MRRVRGLASAASAVMGLALEDPVWLTVQAGRRLPGRWRSRLGDTITRHGRTPVVQAWGHLLQDHTAEARAVLPAEPTGGALDASLRVHLGLPPDPDRSPTASARAAWLTGDLAVLEQVRDDTDAPSRARLVARDHLALLSAQPRPLPPAPRSAGPRPDGAPRALHVLTNSLPFTRSGYTFRTHSILTTQRSAGIAVSAVTRPGYPTTVGRPWFKEVDVIDEVPYHRVAPLRLPPTEAGRVDLWAEHITTLAREHGATVLHTTTHYPNALATEAAARALDIPWVYEVRGQLERTWAAARAAAGDPDPTQSSRFRQWHAAEAEVASRADAVITLSAAMADDLAHRGVPQDRITIVPNGIDESLLSMPLGTAAARSALGLPDAGFWVGSVTSVVHYEGMLTLVEAVAEARRQGHDIRAAIVGDGVAFPALASRVAQCGLQDVVLLPGRLARDRALTWLEALDAVAVPRLDHDVTRKVPPLKLVEGLGAGRPVIISDLPAMTEIVEHDSSALVVRPGDTASLSEALISMAGDASLRDRLRSAGRDIAADRTWGAAAQTYRSTYARLASQHE